MIRLVTEMRLSRQATTYPSSDPAEFPSNSPALSRWPGTELASRSWECTDVPLGGVQGLRSACARDLRPGDREHNVRLDGRWSAGRNPAEPAIPSARAGRVQRQWKHRSRTPDIRSGSFNRSARRSDFGIQQYRRCCRPPVPVSRQSFGRTIWRIDGVHG